MSGPISRSTPHSPVATPAQPPSESRTSYPKAYARGLTNAEKRVQTSASDFRALRGAYEKLSCGHAADVHFIYNSNHATVAKTASGHFLIKATSTSQPFDPLAKEDVVRMSPTEVSGQNGNTGKALTHEEQQMLIKAAVSAMERGHVRKTRFPLDTRVMGL